MRNYRIECEDRSSPQATATIGTAQHAKAQTTRRPALTARTPVDLQRNPPQSLNLQLLPDRIQQNWRQNIYQCSECETRYLAEQWCPDCARPCQRLGPGGICRQLPGDDHRSGTSPRCLPAPVGMYSECTQNVLSTATNAHRYPTVAAGICAGQRPVPLILNDSHPCEGSSRCTTICEAHKPLTC